MKFEFTTKPFVLDGVNHRALIKVRMLPTTCHVHWDIHEVDNISRFAYTTGQSTPKYIEPITEICNRYLKVAWKMRVKHARASWSFCWGSIQLHRDQFTTFLCEFLPLWESLIAQGIQECTGKEVK